LDLYLFLFQGWDDTVGIVSLLAFVMAALLHHHFRFRGFLIGAGAIFVDTHATGF